MASILRRSIMMLLANIYSKPENFRPLTLFEFPVINSFVRSPRIASIVRGSCRPMTVRPNCVVLLEPLTDYDTRLHRRSEQPAIQAGGAED